MSEKNPIIHDKSNLLEMLIESTKTAYIILNQDGTILEANKYFLNMIRCDNYTNILNRYAKLFICEKDWDKYEDYISKLLKGSETEDIDLCINNNILSKTDVMWINIKSGLMKNGTIKIFCIINDITNIKQKEMGKYISDEKKKDKIKQSILKLREFNKRK
jgi:PAS domain S-box-containing protein